MKKKQAIKKVQDIDRTFIVLPETDTDYWRDQLEMFFDENDAGMDHMRQFKEISRMDVDNYYFTSGYEVALLFPKKLEVSLHLGKKKSKTLNTRMGNFTMVYESTGCFRYALPEERAIAEREAALS